MVTRGNKTFTTSGKANLAHLHTFHHWKISIGSWDGPKNDLTKPHHHHLKPMLPHHHNENHQFQPMATSIFIVEEAHSQ